MGNYAPVNQLQLYYETHGNGKPLVLLHGGFGVISMFEQLLPALAATRQVIAVELQGHGHTADVDRPFSFEQMADDIAALIINLGLEKADLLGYSLGGSVALQVAIRHPQVVRKLVVLSAPYKRGGWFPEVLQGMSSISIDTMNDTIIYEAYSRVAPHPEDWPRLVEKTRNLLTTDYNWAEGVAALQMPTLLVFGDADSVRTSHAVEMFELLGGGNADGAMTGPLNAQLAVLPGTTHFSILNRTDLLLPILTPFLDAPQREKK